MSPHRIHVLLLALLGFVVVALVAAPAAVAHGSGHHPQPTHHPAKTYCPPTKTSHSTAPTTTSPASTSTAPSSSTPSTSEPSSAAPSTAPRTETTTTTPSPTLTPVGTVTVHPPLAPLPSPSFSVAATDVTTASYSLAPATAIERTPAPRELAETGVQVWQLAAIGVVCVLAGVVVLCLLPYRGRKR